jgi:2-dehydropantoate 2-reductase
MPLPPHPRIAVVGAGALGGYIGVRLAAAGHDVHFHLRSDLDAVRAGGFIVEMADGARHVIEHPQVYPDTAAIGPCDLVLVGLKTTRNEVLRELLPPLLGPATVVLTLQNGIGNVEFLTRHFPAARVAAALCQIGVNRTAPGRIRNYVPRGGTLQLGESGDQPGELTAWLRELFAAAGLHVRVPDSLGEAVWRKLMWNVPFNGLTVAIGGAGTDRVCNDPELRAVARALMEELRHAAIALGYAIEPDLADKLLTFTDGLGPYLASSVLDYRAGREIEVDAIFAEPLRRGTAAGVAMPHLRTLTAILGGMKVMTND